jgi:hypothetical protein
VNLRISVSQIHARTKADLPSMRSPLKPKKTKSSEGDVSSDGGSDGEDGDLDSVPVLPIESLRAPHMRVMNLFPTEEDLKALAMTRDGSLNSSAVQRAQNSSSLQAASRSKQSSQDGTMMQKISGENGRSKRAEIVEVNVDSKDSFLESKSRSDFDFDARTKALFGTSRTTLLFLLRWPSSVDSMDGNI